MKRFITMISVLTVIDTLFGHAIAGSLLCVIVMIIIDIMEDKDSLTIKEKKVLLLPRPKLPDVDSEEYFARYMPKV